MLNMAANEYITGWLSGKDSKWTIEEKTSDTEA